MVVDIFDAVIYGWFQPPVEPSQYNGHAGYDMAGAAGGAMGGSYMPQMMQPEVQFYETQLSKGMQYLS